MTSKKEHKHITILVPRHTPTESSSNHQIYGFLSEYLLVVTFASFPDSALIGRSSSTDTHLTLNFDNQLTISYEHKTLTNFTANSESVSDYVSIVLYGSKSTEELAPVQAATIRNLISDVEEPLTPSSPPPPPSLSPPPPPPPPSRSGSPVILSFTVF